MAPCDRDAPHLIFVRGQHFPRAIAWFGFSSFWGHLWHLAASAVATEDIDARDWMQADDSEVLTDRVARRLLSPDTRVSHTANEDAKLAEGTGLSLSEQLDSDIWIDFVADTGDDSDVSEAVADMLFRDYEVDDPDGGGVLIAPRGHILAFGGDTAYPVATQIEIHNRVCVPFGRVLRERIDETPRVLLGIPGNHDWYDGLDGFARMFRARRGTLGRASADSQKDEVDRGGQIGHFIDWVEAFRVGRFVTKRHALPLAGYMPVQNSSYFALRLAPKLGWWGVDRQLRSVDYTQRSYFAALRDARPDDGLIVCIADPAQAMLQPSAKGRETLDAIQVDLEEEGPLVLTGDTHHYCRETLGAATHVIAGGGGAFLHPARMDGRSKRAPEAEFPGPRASFALAMQVPWQVAAGRAGFMVHVVVAALYLPVLTMQAAGHDASTVCAAIAVLVTFVCGMLGGWRQRHPLMIGALATLYGAWVGILPLATRLLVDNFFPHWLPAVVALASYLLAIYPAALGFGTYLMVLTLLGLERHQAFSSLAHPGYKHFVRLRVHKDGHHVDAWVFGKVDTLDEGCPIVLVDRFRWSNPAYRKTPDAPAPK